MYSGSKAPQQQVFDWRREARCEGGSATVAHDGFGEIMLAREDNARRSVKWMDWGLLWYSLVKNSRWVLKELYNTGRIRWAGSKAHHQRHSLQQLFSSSNCAVFAPWIG